VALKTIPADDVTPEERERFLREAQICAGLYHPNLLRVHDSGEADGILYQAMDLLACQYPSWKPPAISASWISAWSKLASA
jgi:serine/threonine protein kinase